METTLKIIYFKHYYIYIKLDKNKCKITKNLILTELDREFH